MPNYRVTLDGGVVVDVEAKDLNIHPDGSLAFYDPDVNAVTRLGIANGVWKFVQDLAFKVTAPKPKDETPHAYEPDRKTGEDLFPLKEDD